MSVQRRKSLLSNNHRHAAFLVTGGKRSDTTPPTKPTQLKLFSDVIRTEDYITLPAMKYLISKFQALNDEMTLEQFKEAISGEIMQPGPDFDRRINILFRKMDTNNNGLVELDEFCSHFMADLEEKHNLRNEREVPLLVCPHLFENPHRAPIIRVIAQENPTRFVTFSEDGVVAFWTMKMTIHRVIELAQTKGSRPTVFTDAAVMQNAFRVALTSSNRDVCFYETTTGALCNRIVGLSDSVSYLRYTAESASEGKLIWGDLSGAVHILSFGQTSKTLFPTHKAPFGDPNNIPYKIVKNCDPAIVALQKYRPHEASADEVDRSVKMIMHLPRSDFVFSCAALQKSAVVIYSLSRSDYSAFNIPKGAFSFDFSPALNMVVTGGNDCDVRFWNPYVPSHPLAVLKGHASPILHVAFNAGYMQAISVSVNEHIKIWDVNEYVCLNTLAAVIPHASPHNKFPIRNMLWHDATQCMITTTNNEFCVTELSHHDDSAANVTTHAGAVTAMVYLPAYGHLVTACMRGEIKLWDIATGDHLLQVSSAHGAASITSLTTINSDSVLVSTGSDGSVRTWNIFSGVAQQDISLKGLRECTACVTTPENVFFVGSGGSVKSMRRCDGDQASKLIPDALWQPSSSHEGDITCVDYCPDALLATGATDGNVKVWNVNLGKVVSTFNPREKMSRRVPSGKTSNHVQSLLKQATKSVVDKVLWLRKRVSDGNGRRRGCATLVSSGQGGMCHFWSPFKGNLIGWFTAANSKLGREKVLAMTANEDNTVLLTGDTQGYVVIWDIATYCTGDPESRSGDESPHVLAAWRAHVNVILDLKIVTDTTVITASSDCSVRVWSIQGDYIGTFGEGTDSSWILASNTGLSLDDAQEKFRIDSSRMSKHMHGVNGGESLIDALEAKSPGRVRQSRLGAKGSPRGGTLDALEECEDDGDGEQGGARNDGNADGTVASKSPLSKGHNSTSKTKTKNKLRQGTLGSKGSKKASQVLEEHDDGDEDDVTTHATQDNAASMIPLEDIILPTDILGKQVQSHLQLRTLEKKELRLTKSEMDFSRTTHEGFQFCSPFQALEPSPLKDIKSKVREPSAVARQRVRRGRK